MSNIEVKLRPGANTSLPLDFNNKMGTVGGELLHHFKGIKRVEYNTDLNIIVDQMKETVCGLGLQNFVDVVIKEYRDDVLSLTIVVENESVMVGFEYWPDKNNFGDYVTNTMRDYTILNIVNVTNNHDSILLLTIWEVQGE